MAWKVNSVSLRPSRPASNLMVGTHAPKSSPAMVDCCTPLTTAPALPELAALAELALTAAAGAAEAAAAGAAELAAAEAAAPEAAPPAAALVEPSRFWMVKLEKPSLRVSIYPSLGTMLGAPYLGQLRGQRRSGRRQRAAFLREDAALSFSTSEPVTDGSTRGKMPCSSAVAGRLASPQMVGMACANLVSG